MKIPNPILILLFFAHSALFGQVQSSQKLFFEKVYLHTDRDYYFGGEDLWFKAYLLNAQGNQLMPTSNNLFVELISPDNSILQRRIIRLDKGLGNGDFKLTDSLPAGNYSLRAYTNWMRNFGDNFIFSKNIYVTSSINPHTTSPAAGSIKAVSPQAKPATANAQLYFFPEGGSLISNVPAIVAVKAEDAARKGIPARGEIHTGSGSLVTSFETNANGFGSFMFTPLNGETYKLKMNGNNFSSPLLPQALPEGFSLTVSRRDSAKINLIISTNQATLDAYKGRQAEIRLRHTGILQFSAKITIDALQSLIQIPLKALPDGIAAISLTDDKGRPHAERLVYVDKPAQASKLDLKLNRTTFSAKQPVRLTLNLKNERDLPVKANLSLAAVDAGLIPPGKGNILSYLKLESELRGTIEHPEQYFDLSNPLRSRQLDLLLMTQGWRDFVWKRLRDTSLKVSYLNELGFSIAGKVSEKNGSKPLPGTNVTLFANGAKGQKLFTARTNPDGKFYFDNINLLGNQRVKLISHDAKGKKIGAISIDGLNVDTLPLQRKAAVLLDEAALARLASEGPDRMQQARRFSLSDTIKLKEVKIAGSKTARFMGEVFMSFGYPDQTFTVSPQDIKDYTNLRHFLLTKADGATSDTSISSNGILFFAQGGYVRPRFIVERNEDVFDRLDYFDLPMNEIQKIVIRHMISGSGPSFDSVSGRMTSNRDVFLIYLNLKETAFKRKEPSLLNTDVSGYYQQRTFFVPRYPAGGRYTRQDLRTTIHWQPNLETDANGEATLTFYNADPKTNIRVVVQGVTAEGKAVTGSIGYEVR